MGANLICQIPRVQIDFRQFVPEGAKCLLRLSSVSENELKDVINNLNIGQWTWRHPSNHCERVCCGNHIQPSIVNRSFKSGCFPSHLQKAKVIPIFKNSTQISFRITDPFHC